MGPVATLVLSVLPVLLHGRAGIDLVPYLEEHGREPADYIAEKFGTYDVVLLGEDHAVRQTLVFVQDLIPVLYSHGVTNLGMEFGASEDQGLLDELTTSRSYDDELARRIMFNYNTVWSWREYRDIYRKVQAFNRTLPAGAERFRVLNLSYRYDWRGFEGQRTPANMARVFHKGTADKYRSELIEREVLGKGEKILALVGTPHAFTRYESPVYSYNADDFCAFDANWLGNRLLRRHPGKVFSVIVHQPFYNHANQSPLLLSPAGGTIEKLLRELGNRPLAFDLGTTPAGRLPEASAFSMCYPDFTLGQLFDGYVFLVPFSDVEPATIDEDFVTEDNAAAAIAQFPDPDWHGRPASLDDLRRRIRAMAREIEKKYAAVE
ncbi:MAG TPA: ChaN family lipoprotein [Woeseiaceae bacterium]|nr:ChaN family lipoprotein [Woeseiaceae bacterium]